MPEPPPPLQFAQMRKAYVPLYAQHLRAAAGPGGSSQGGTPTAAGGKPLSLELKAMDTELPEGTILMFRRLAYAEVGGRAGWAGG